MSSRVRALWIGAHVAVTFLAFPFPVGGGVLDLGSFAAWGIPLTAAAAVRGLTPGRALGTGLLAGLLAQAAVLHWAFVVTYHYGNAPLLVGALAPFGMALYGSIFQGLWCGLLAWVARGVAAGAVGLAAPFALAAGWTFLDYARSFVMTGFPWGTLGYAQHGSPLMALAPWTGVVGLAFVTVLGGIGGLALLAPGTARALGVGDRRAGIAAIAVCLLLAVPARVAWAPPPEGDVVRAAVLQGNVEQGVKWSPDWAERTLAIYAGLTRRAAARGAELIAWPETAVPGSPDADEALRQRLVSLAAEVDATLVVGAVGVEFAPDDGPPRLFDSAYVITGEGVLGRYDKSHLVPFGEYLPFRPLLGRFIRAIATGSAGRDVTEGSGPRVFDVPLGERTVRVGVPICYELLFPDLMRRFAGAGGQLLLALTNDAWYGRSGAPYQFLSITKLRAAESGVWIGRSANTGISARIDGRGRVREQTGIFETDLLVGPVPPRRVDEGTTFYVRHGDAFAWACGAFVLAFGLVAGRASRRSPA